MAEKKVALTKQDRIAVCWRSTFLQGSWNYERMQNGGFCYAMIPAIKRLYTTKEEQAAALKRHLEFFNTQPYVGAPILGVTLALEEDRANGAPVDNAAIQGVKVGMMGPLAGVGDPIFWFTVRPILGALAASFAMSGNILGPILFFVLWNVIRYAFLWYTQEFGYNFCRRSHRVLPSWVCLFSVPWFSAGFPSASRSRSPKYSCLKALTLTGQTFPRALKASRPRSRSMLPAWNSLVPGLAALLLTFLCMYLLKKKVSPIVIILGLFVVGIVFHVIGLM